MSHDEFRNMVAKMMDAQKKYFRSRLTSDLDDSKALERQVRRALAEFAAPPTLFDVFDREPHRPSRDAMIAEVDETA